MNEVCIMLYYFLEVSTNVLSAFPFSFNIYKADFISILNGALFYFHVYELAAFFSSAIVAYVSVLLAAGDKWNSVKLFVWFVSSSVCAHVHICPSVR